MLAITSPLSFFDTIISTTTVNKSVKFKYKNKTISSDDTKMTDAFTHYFLSTSLTWIALGRRRSLFLESWRRNLYFLIISLSSVVMDTDLLFDASIHRLFTHTIILPVLFLALGIVSWRLLPSYPLAYVSCFIISALTITHLLLDLDGLPPMSLFYPFIDQCYSIQLFVNLNLHQFPFISFNPIVQQYSINEWIGQEHVTSGLELDVGLIAVSLLIFLFSVIIYGFEKGAHNSPENPTASKQTKT